MAVLTRLGPLEFRALNVLKIEKPLDRYQITDRVLNASDHYVNVMHRAGLDPLQVVKRVNPFIELSDNCWKAARVEIAMTFFDLHYGFDVAVAGGDLK